MGAPRWDEEAALRRPGYPVAHAGKERAAMTGPNVFVGCDLSDKTASMCVLDARGRVIARADVRLREPEMTAWFSRQPRARVVLEVGSHSAWVSRLLKRVGHEAIVANPR